MSDVPPFKLTTDILWSFVDMTKNNLSTIGSYKNIFKNMIISPFPCDASKSVTDKICGFSLGLGGITNFKPIAFKQIRHLADKSRNIVRNMMTGGNIEYNSAQLERNMQKIEEINKENKDSILCGISKFFTHGICKINEINIRLLTDDIKVGLIGSSIIPDKLQSAFSSMRNINDSNLEGEDLQEALGEIDSDLGDINDVNDSMEEAMNKETNKNKKSNKSQKPIKQKKGPVPKKQSKRAKSKVRRQRGGDFSSIIDPISNKSVNINSKRGKQLINIYSKVL